MGERFYVKTKPTPVSKPTLIKFNDELANTLGILATDHDADEAAALFSGNTIPEGAEPLAMAYAGHQFGSFNPQLGDGRAILLGEICTENACFGVQLKGSGRTAYSRGGDGRASLGPVLREYLLSEAMFKLNVPTTRALAAVTTGEQVARDSLLPGGVITRIASSFVRVGTFQYFANQDDDNVIKQLADHVIETNYPEAAAQKQPYVSFLQAVITRQANLIAQWMQLGFIHGVMNTDNMSIAGETIDYGPCAFMDSYNHNKVFSSIDRNGRYAYSNQPEIGLWDLTRLAETLLPLLADNIDAAVEVAQTLLKDYVAQYEHVWLSGMCAKCGLTLSDDTEQSDRALIKALLDLMAENNADFTLTFYNLSKLKIQPSDNDNDCRILFDDPAQFDIWAARWRERLSQETQSDEQRRTAMLAVNPVYIPRNHQVEAAIRAAEDHGDFSVFHELHEVLQNPFQLQPGKDRYQLPPELNEVVSKTFCGT